MILLLDVGNSRLKWRLDLGEETVDRGVLQRADSGLLPLLTQNPREVWVSSVAGAEFESSLRQACTERWGLDPWFARSSAGDLGLSNSYSDPSRMGVDRWLAMLAAWRVYGGSVCVVDAGSALTIDFVSEAGEHEGGYILPGLDSMEGALLQDTDRVRFGDAPRDCIEPGRSTETAVFNGLFLSQVGAVSQALQITESRHLVASGGNGEALLAALDRPGDYRQDLVLEGLKLLGAEGVESA